MEIFHCITLKTDHDLGVIEFACLPQASILGPLAKGVFRTLLSHVHKTSCLDNCLRAGCIKWFATFDTGTVIWPQLARADSSGILASEAAQGITAAKRELEARSNSMEGSTCSM